MSTGRRTGPFHICGGCRWTAISSTRYFELGDRDVEWARKYYAVRAGWSRAPSYIIVSHRHEHTWWESFGLWHPYLAAWSFGTCSNCASRAVLHRLWWYSGLAVRIVVVDLRHDCDRLVKHGYNGYVSTPAHIRIGGQVNHKLIILTWPRWTRSLWPMVEETWLKRPFWQVKAYIICTSIEDVDNSVPNLLTGVGDMAKRGRDIGCFYSRAAVSLIQTISINRKPLILGIFYMYFAPNTRYLGFGAFSYKGDRQCHRF